MLVLFTDFGLHGPYVGQMHAALVRHGAGGPIIDLMHDAPAFRPRAAGHLLAALARDFPVGSRFVAVVDPGVGGERLPVVVHADGHWFVGPHNGLFDVVAARAERAQWWRITRAPEGSAATFHGRDLFAPVAALLAQGESIPGEPFTPRLPASAGDDLAEIILVDPFGNAVTGLRPPAHAAVLRAAGHDLQRVRTFADMAPGEAGWLANSAGLVEIAANRASAAESLGLRIGDGVEWLA